MRIPPTAAAVIAAMAIAGCDGSSTVQPARQMASPSLSKSPNAAPQSSGKPEIDPTYANGTTVYMIGPRMIPDAVDSMPNAYAHAEELYLVVYPQEAPPQPGAGPITLPSGYQPQCDPCFHPGLPAPFVYHDHVVTGAPGMGVNGTAWVYKSPWKIILLEYNPAYVASPTFTPIKTVEDLKAAEAPDSNVFVELIPGADNPYEIDTGNLLICPMVSDHA